MLIDPRFSICGILCTSNIERDVMQNRNKFKFEDQKVNLFIDLPELVYNL